MITDRAPATNRLDSGRYHSPADTPDSVDPASLVSVCRLVVATARLASGKVSSLIGDKR
jgi:hypothetical protein